MMFYVFPLFLSLSLLRCVDLSHGCILVRVQTGGFASKIIKHNTDGSLEGTVITSKYCRAEYSA